MHRDGTTDATFAAINSDFYNNVRSKKWRKTKEKENTPWHDHDSVVTDKMYLSLISVLILILMYSGPSHLPRQRLPHSQLLPAWAVHWRVQQWTWGPKLCGLYDEPA
jgi:hypothetical protein